MTRYFCMLLRKKKIQKKVTIKNNKPRFLRINSGEFNFNFDDMKNHVSIFKIINLCTTRDAKLIQMLKKE